MDSKLGFLGTVTTFASGLCSWLLRHEAELRALSYLITICVGLLTVAWWIRKWWRAFSGASDELDN